MKRLTEFRQDAGIKSNPKKLAAQGELPKGQERVAWAMYVSFFSSQTGKCRSVKPMCRGHIGSVGSACLQVEEPTGAASACTRLQTQKNACIFLTIGCCRFRG